MLVTTKQSWSVTGSLEQGVETEVKADIPILASGTVKASLKLSISSTYQRKHLITEKQSFQFPIAIHANKQVKAAATIYEGNIDMEYKGHIKYALDSGKEFGYDVKETYSGVAVSQAVISVEPIN